jgi:hypothetical protein
MIRDNPPTLGNVQWDLWWTSDTANSDSTKCSTPTHPGLVQLARQCPRFVWKEREVCVELPKEPGTPGLDAREATRVCVLPRAWRDSVDL